MHRIALHFRGGKVGHHHAPNESGCAAHRDSYAQ
jgi:hypothetical protein